MSLDNMPVVKSSAFAKQAEAYRKRIAELETLNARLRNEVVENLYAQMLRCSEDAAQGYEVPGGGDELEPVCGTECQCPLDCSVYQRWLDMTDIEAGAVEKSSTGSEKGGD